MVTLQTRMRSLAIAAALVVAGNAGAAPFDERIRAPKSLSPSESRAGLARHFAAVERKRSDASPAAFIRDEAAYRQWSDLFFQLNRTLDEGQNPGDLSAFGALKQADGSYVVKLKDYPQWRSLDSRLGILRDPGVFEGFSVELKERGFRDQDVATMRAYIEHNNPERASFADDRVLLETFAVKLQARQRKRLALDQEQVQSYVYQRWRQTDEAQRRWAIGLLDALDPQRQRILVSFFEELDTTTIFKPSDIPIERRMQELTAPILSGEYLRDIRQREAEVNNAR